MGEATPQKTETLTDQDGNTYSTVVIGTQVWTVENWRSTKYNDRTDIPYVAGDEWGELTTGAFCYYENDSTNKAKYGALYNWYAVNTGRIAPEGWRVPTYDDWTALENYLRANGFNWDGTTSGNKIAKSMATKTDWDTSSKAGGIGNDLSKNNASGFSALPGGSRSYEGIFAYLNLSGYWWSATESDATCAWGLNLIYARENLDVDCIPKSNGFSLRLVRDLDAGEGK
jgi:uncharacterized protein (TIGR02145 family)